MDELKQKALGFFEALKGEGETLKKLESALRKKKLLLKGQSALPAVEGLIEDGRLYEHPPKSAKGGPLFSTQSPLDYTSGRILTLVKEGKKPPSTTQLKTKLKKYSEHVDVALSGLLKEEKLFLLRAGKKDLLYTKRPPYTEALTMVQKNQLNKMLMAINANRMSALTLEQVLAFLDGEQEKARPKSPIAPSPAPPPALGMEELEALLLKWYGEDIHLMRGSKALPIPYTWKRYEQWAKGQGMEADLKLFHEALWDLSAKGKAGLVHHDMPSNIAKDEQACLFKTKGGYTVYYWILKQ